MSSTNFDFSPNGGSPELFRTCDGYFRKSLRHDSDGRHRRERSCIRTFALQQGGSWTENVLHTFEGSPDGSQPEAGLLQGANGKLFGTTFFGGDSDGSGIVFQVAAKH